MPSLRDVVDLLESWYPPQHADSWDAVGLVCGDPEADVRRVLLAVDPVLDVAQEATQWRADLVVVHHPLFLKGTTSVAATTRYRSCEHSLQHASASAAAAASGQ